MTGIALDVARRRETTLIIGDKMAQACQLYRYWMIADPASDDVS